MRAAAAVLALLALAAPAFAEEPPEPTPLERARAAVAEGDIGAAESILTPWVRDHPADLEAATLRARVLGWLGRHDESLEAFDRVLALAPDDVDVLLGKSYVLWFAGRPAEARPLLERVLERAPEYEDAWRLHVRVLEGLGDRAARDRAAAEVARRFPGREREVLAGPRGRGEIEAGVRHDRLSGGRDPWSEQYLDALFHYGWPRGPTPLSPREALELRLRRARRYGEEDAGAAARLTAPIDRAWTAALGAEANPGAEFLPRVRREVEVSRPLGAGLAAAAGAFRARYDEDAVQGGFLRVEAYSGPWRFAAQGTGTRLLGEESVWGGRLSLDRSYGFQDRGRIGASINFGREIESVPGGVRTDSVTGGSVYVRHRLSDRWALSGEVSVQRQGSVYTRTGVLLGVRYAF